jgi:hypothetical protein
MEKDERLIDGGGECVWQRSFHAISHARYLSRRGSHMSPKNRWHLLAKRKAFPSFVDFLFAQNVFPFFLPHGVFSVPSKHI